MSEEIGHNGPPEDVVWYSGTASWIALTRCVREHPIVGFGQPVKPATESRGSYSRGEAWIDMLMLANYKPARYNNKGQVVTLDVGQLLGARAFLSTRWNWSEKTVRVFLDTLAKEGMIEGEEKGQQNGSARANKCTVITICNYKRYQYLQDMISEYVRGLEGPAKGQQRASNGASNGASNPTQKGPAKDQQEQVLTGSRGQQRASVGASNRASEFSEKGQNLTLNTGSNYPPAPQGGTPDRAKRGERAAKTRAENERRRAEAEQVRDAYNEQARRLGCTVCEILTDERLKRILKRVDDLGGLEPVLKAIAVIDRDPFLSGKVQGRGGTQFRLDIDRLLSTGSGLGDVLARLLEKASERSATGYRYWWQDPDKLATVDDNGWRHLITKHAAQSAPWPVDKLGPPPGHHACVVPTNIAAEFKLAQRYDANGLWRT